MAIIKLYNKTGDAKAVEIQENIEKELGFLPEFTQAMGRNGDFLEAAMQALETSGKGLDPKVRELLIIATSAVNGCNYCVSAHRAMGIQAGLTDEEITAALEVASTASMFNNFLKAMNLNLDIKA